MSTNIWVIQMFKIDLRDIAMGHRVNTLHNNPEVAREIDDYTACLLNHGRKSHETISYEDEILNNYGELGVMIIDFGHKLALITIKLMRESLDENTIPINAYGLKDPYHATVEDMVVYIF